MSDFWTVAEAYRSAEVGSIYEVHVASEDVQRVARAHHELQRMRSAGEEAVSELATAFQYARYRLVCAPLPLTHPDLQLGKLMGEAHKLSQSFSEGSRPRMVAADGLSAMERLLEDGAAPIADQVIERISEAKGERCCVALRSGRYVEGVRAFLREKGLEVDVADGKGVRALGLADLLLCVGPTGFFPEALITAPRADTTCFITYPFSRSSKPTGGLFGELGGLAIPKVRAPAPSDGETTLDPLDFSAAMAEAATRVATRRESGGGALVKSVMFALAGGYAVWTEEEERNKLLCVDADDPEHPVIVSKYLGAIQPGDYLILRDGEAEPDLIRTLADSKFDARKYRPSQEAWKAALREAVSKVGGVSIAAKRLREMGAGASNLAYWIGNRCIRPQSLKDFAAVCRFAGIADDTTRLWQDLQEITKAHVNAGQLIRQQLVELLKQDGAGQLIREGIQRSDIPDLGSLITLRVLYRLPEPGFVNQTQIDRPFLAMEGGWPE